MPDIVAGVIGIALVFIWIYCLYDVVTTHDGLVRNLPKIAWFVIVLLIPDLGSILWLCFGRPRIQSRRVVTVDGLRPRGVGVGGGGSELDMPSLDHLHPVVREREELARLRMMQAQLQRRENELRQRGLGESADS
jgi:hypothetical protein